MTGGASPRRRGDYFERQTRAYLETHGWLVVRAGGSLGVADLLAISRHHSPLLVSCKLGGKIRPRERDAITMAAKRYGAHAVVAWRPTRGLIGWHRLYPEQGDNDGSP
jgi:Holliday junction resolvase